ncbi:hypothetical protein PR048_007055 [Dryococelus australis]|uniref:Uncharacterized protein n=1 Tax=Dryococelus australis TaxID=614101 RepID=A0ABQ9ICL5_9NEOP|nr:hypothetical protein PR048_007055 [Dryococelus australis]
MKLTNKLNESFKRKTCELQRAQSQTIFSNITAEEYIGDNEHYSSDILDDEDDEKDECKPSTSSTKPNWQMRVQLGATALNSDHFGASNSATAAIASRVLQDIEKITYKDYSSGIHKCKIRIEKSSVRTNMKCTPNADTLFVEKVKTKHFYRNRKEEHCSLIQETGSTYIGHVSPFLSSSTDIT